MKLILYSLLVTLQPLVLDPFLSRRRQRTSPVPCRRQPSTHIGIRRLNRWLRRPCQVATPATWPRQAYPPTRRCQQASMDQQVMACRWFREHLRVWPSGGLRRLLCHNTIQHHYLRAIGGRGTTVVILALPPRQGYRLPRTRCSRCHGRTEQPTWARSQQRMPINRTGSVRRGCSIRNRPRGTSCVRAWFPRIRASSGDAEG